jgi:isopenicillin N synthase-like dioxygenase
MATPPSSPTPVDLAPLLDLWFHKDGENVGEQKGPAFSAANDLLEALRRHGWARVSLGGSDADAEVSRALASLRASLDTSRREKLVGKVFNSRTDDNLERYQCAYDDQRETGVSLNARLGKRFFAYRRSHAASERFPAFETGTEDFSPRVRELWRSSDLVARVVLSSLAVALQVDPGSLLGLCADPDDAFESPSDKDESMLHLFDYFQKPLPSAMSAACPEHTDSGLVTIIPESSASGGLQCLDWDAFQWIDVEAPESVVVLVGETLSRLTCCYLRATVHRVEFEHRRLSTPFQLRARRDAVIDSAALGCELFDVPEALREKVRVGDFIT